MKRNKGDSGTAAVLSFVFSGLGQLYKGQIVKGLVIIFFAGSSLLLVVLGAVLVYLWLTQQLIFNLLWMGITLFIIGLILVCVIGAYSIFDAYGKVKR